MKTTAIFAALAMVSGAYAQTNTGSSFTNFIRQVQIRPGVPQSQWVEWDMQNIAASGDSLSPLAIDPGGARFELWTVKATSPPISYLLDSRYVSTYIPTSNIKITSGDPYTTIPRTRADRPFRVEIDLSFIKSDPNAQAAAYSATLLRHVQSYGTNGTGVGIDRTQATQLGTQTLTQEGKMILNFAGNSVPGSNRAKIRGEERFSVFSVADYQAPASQLASQFIQIWPVADGSISGITNNSLIQFKLPPLTFTVNDVYPGSSVYAQAYKGAPQLGTVGTVVPGSAKNYSSQTIPQNHLESVSSYESIFDEDGQWTIELLTETPFGLERLHHVTFHLDRTIQMNGTVTTIAD